MSGIDRVLTKVRKHDAKVLVKRIRKATRRAMDGEGEWRFAAAIGLDNVERVRRAKNRWADVQVFYLLELGRRAARG